MNKNFQRVICGLIISGTFMCPLSTEASWKSIGNAMLRGMLEGLTTPSSNTQASEEASAYTDKVPNNGRFIYFTNDECWQAIPGLVGKKIDLSSIYVTEVDGKKVIYYWRRKLQDDGKGYYFDSCRVIPAERKGSELGVISYSWNNISGDDSLWMRNRLFEVFSSEEIEAITRYVEENGIHGAPESDMELNLEASPQERSIYLHYLPPHRYVPILSDYDSWACFRDATTTRYYVSNGIKMENSDYRIFPRFSLQTKDGKNIYHAVIIANIEKPVYANNVKIKKIKYCFDKEGNVIDINTIKEFGIEEISKTLGNDYLNVKHGI